MVLGARISLTKLLQATVLFSAVSCNGCDDDGGPPIPPPEVDAPIASVEIMPSRASVEQGAIFTLRARVKDRWGNVLEDGRAAVVQWTTSGELTVDNRPASSVVVTATPSTPPPPDKDIYIIASVNGVEKSDSSTIQIIAPPESDQRDWIVSVQTPSAQPSYAFVTGESNYGEAVARTNSLLAFAGKGQLERLYCPTAPQCGVVTLLSPDHALSQVPVAWTGGCDIGGFVAVVTFPPTCRTVTPPIPTPLPQRLPVPVEVWTLAKKDGIDNQVNADRVYAEWVFDQPLVGLKLNFAIHPYAVNHTAISHGFGCKTADGRELSTVLTPLGVTFDTKRITVVYVDAINPGTGDAIGFTCPHDNATGTLVVVSADAINNSTFAHELGHALGQWHSAERDHPDYPPPRLEGFEPSNLMWSGESDWGVSLRRNISLGQLFQMSLADFSFVKRSQISAGAGLPCSSDAASNSPCPMLARDQR